MDKLRILGGVTCALLAASLILSIAALAVPGWTHKDTRSNNHSSSSSIGLFQFCGSHLRGDGCTTHWHDRPNQATEIDGIIWLEWFKACAGMMLFGSLSTLISLILLAWQSFAAKTIFTLQLIAGILVFCAGFVKAMVAAIWMMMFSGAYPAYAMYEAQAAADYCQGVCYLGHGAPLAITAAIFDLLACVVASAFCWLRADAPKKQDANGPYDIEERSDKGHDGPYVQHEMYERT